MIKDSSEELARITRRLSRRAIAGLCALFVLLALLIALVVLASMAMFEAAGLLWSLVWLTLAAFAAWNAWQLGCSLLAPTPAPEGVALPRDLAPSLYEFVDRVGAATAGVPVDTVWITGDVNAAVLRRPRHGLVGRLKTHLLIGLPLAHSVSERQLAAIVAHEYGHLALQQKSADAWGAQLRGWWFRAIDNIIGRMSLLGRLLDWITHQQVLTALRAARIEEFAADRTAAQACGPDLVARTLVEVAARERFLRCDFWVKVMAQCADSPRPRVRPYRDMGLGLVAGFLPGDGRGDCLHEMIDGQDGTEAFHPTLAERLAALGESPQDESLIEDSFAERHLSLLLPRLAWELDRAWWARMRREWRHNYLRMRLERFSADD
jgi:Zn-dependent protease with chaperone function